MNIKYKAGFKYQLAETAIFQTAIYPNVSIDTEYIRLTVNGKLTILKGYAWDGPSGPTFDTKTFMRGSLVHDALYQLIRLKKLSGIHHRKQADNLLRILCLKDGMTKVRAWWVYKALRIVGSGAAKSSHVKAILIAPNSKMEK